MCVLTVEVSLVNHTYLGLSFLFPLSESLLVGVFRSITFCVITDTLRFKPAVFLFVFYLSVCSLYISLPFLAFLVSTRYCFSHSTFFPLLVFSLHFFYYFFSGYCRVVVRKVLDQGPLGEILVGGGP